jgi:hypothetical protein
LKINNFEVSLIPNDEDGEQANWRYGTGFHSILFIRCTNDDKSRLTRKKVNVLLKSPEFKNYLSETLCNFILENGNDKGSFSQAWNSSIEISNSVVGNRIRFDIVSYSQDNREKIATAIREHLTV